MFQGWIFRAFYVVLLSDFVSSGRETVPYSGPGTWLSSRDPGPEAWHCLALLDVLSQLETWPISVHSFTFLWRWCCDGVLAARTTLVNVMKLYENRHGIDIWAHSKLLKTALFAQVCVVKGFTCTLREWAIVFNLYWWCRASVRQPEI